MLFSPSNKIVNLENWIDENNCLQIRFGYVGSPTEQEIEVKIVDLETELCVHRDFWVLSPGVTYWMGVSSNLTNSLRWVRLEFHFPEQESFLFELDHIPQPFWLDNRKFLPRTMGDAAYGAFVEVEILKIYAQYGIGVQPGDVVVDIGANYGFFCVHAIKSGAARIVAVEPDPNTFSCLAQNVSHLPGIELCQAAVASISGTGNFSSTSTNGGNFLTQNSEYIVDFPDSLQEYKVRTVSFPDLMSLYNLEKINFLKVDCEGGEIDLFLSLNNFELALISNIVIEYHSMKGRDILLSHLQPGGFFLLNPLPDTEIGLLYLTRSLSRAEEK